MVIYGTTNSYNSTLHRWGRSMVLDRRTDGDLRRSSDPDYDHGWSAGSRQTGDGSMATPELEESILVDEVLSDISSAGVDGNYVSRHLRVSIESALRTYGEYGWD